MVQIGREHLTRANLASRHTGQSRVVEMALLERQGRLLSAVGDTALSPARRRNAASELLLIAALSPRLPTFVL
jgi:hypothetical protein